MALVSAARSSLPAHIVMLMGEERQNKSRISSKSYKCNTKRLALELVLIFLFFFL